MDINKILTFIKSKKITIAIMVVLGFALLFGTFSAGMAIGFRKAKFSYAWGDNYHRNFGGPKGGFFRDLGRDLSGADFIDAHGTFGQIIKIDGNTMILKGKDNMERFVIIGDKSTIMKGRELIKVTDLKIDDQVTVIGDPDDQGQIAAKFIRLFQ